VEGGTAPDLRPSEEFLRLALDLALRNVRSGRGGPFGAVVARGKDVVATGANGVVAFSDPTAHAEISAIRAACAALRSFQIEGCDLYTSCEPCPMCLGAIYWARPRAVFYTATRHDAAAAGFDDAFVYEQIALAPEERDLPMRFVPHPDAHAPFAAWAVAPGKVEY
jgi:guanine deaminase